MTQQKAMLSEEKEYDLKNLLLLCSKPFSLVFMIHHTTLPSALIKYTPAKTIPKPTFHKNVFPIHENKYENIFASRYVEANGNCPDLVIPSGMVCEDTNHQCDLWICWELGPPVGIALGAGRRQISPFHSLEVREGRRG